MLQNQPREHVPGTPSSLQSPAASRQLRRLCASLWLIALFGLLAVSASAVDPVITSGPVILETPGDAAPLARILEVETAGTTRVSVVATSGAESFERHFEARQKVHSLTLVGFKPDRVYDVQVSVRNAQEVSVDAEPLAVVTDPLPANFPTLDLKVSQPAKMEPGYTLLLPSNRTLGANYITIVDENAEVIWYYATVGGDLRQLPNGNLFYWMNQTDTINELNMRGEIVRQWYMNQSPDSSAPAGSILVDLLPLHHENFPTDYGTILSTTHEPVIITDYPTSTTDPELPPADATVTDDPIYEFNRKTGAIHGEWSLMDILDPRRISYSSISTDPERNHDWGHINAVIHDPRDDSIIVSIRHQDAVVKFSRLTGDLIWILGPPANWAPEFQPFLLTPVGTPFEWPYHTHAPMITAQGTMVLYDNGNNRASPFDGTTPLSDAENYSRAVEFDIDEEAMEVRQVWEYGGNTAETLYTRFIGDADSLSTTGNTLITFGGISYVNHVATNGTAVRIIEVDHGTPAEVLFDLSIEDPTPGTRGWRVYRSERIPDVYAAPISVSLSADTASPATLSSLGDVTFTATATGGSDEYEYEWWVRDPDNNPTRVRNYGEGSTYVWPDAAPAPTSGSWTIQVRVREAGSSAVLEAFAGFVFEVLEDNPVTSVALDSTVDGLVYSFVATASGGSGDPDYQYWVRDPLNRPTLMQDYGNGDSFVWTPLYDGRWVVQVRARNIDSTASWEAFRGRSFQITGTPAVSSVSLSADKSSPILEAAGDVTFTAVASGGTGTTEFQFWQRNSAGDPTLLQDYGSSDTLVWTPPSLDSWIIQVRARNSGSVQRHEAFKGMPFAVVAAEPVTSVSLVADQPKTLSLAAGNVTFTASASGGNGDPEYQYYVRDPDNNPTLVQNYGASPTFVWTPPDVGSWVIQVRARNVGSPASWEAFKGVRFNITP